MACSPKTHPWLLNISSGWVWKEWLHSTSAKWLVDLRADCSNHPEQEPVNITKADIQQVSGVSGWLLWALLSKIICSPSCVFTQCGKCSWRTASSQHLMSNSGPAAIFPAGWRTLSSHWMILYRSSASRVISNTSPVRIQWNKPEPGHLNLQDIT